MKLKLTNKTTNNLWLAEYCFIPGITETEELSSIKEKELKECLDKKTMIDRIEKGLIIVEWIDEKKKNKKTELQEGLM